MKKVLIADDHILFSTGLKEVFETAEGLSVVGMVQEGKKVVGEVRKYQPDVLVLDLNMKDTTGFSIMEELELHSSDLITIVVTMYKDELLISKAKKLGANAYMLKESEIEELIETVLSVTKNEFYITKVLADKKENKTLDEMPFDGFESKQKLTRRELEILKMIANGKSSKAIADTLFYKSINGKYTPEEYEKKLTLYKISELVSYAYKTNLI